MLLITKVCLAGALDADEAPTRGPNQKHPHYLGVICRADIVMRSSQWDNIKRRVDREIGMGSAPECIERGTGVGMHHLEIGERTKGV